MSRHPLNLSLDARAARNPKTLQLIQMINQAAISPAIDLDDLADIPALVFSDRYEALAIMRHACRVITDGLTCSFVLLTRTSQVCMAQFDRRRGETQDECDAILRRMASAYSAYCNDNGAAIESLDVLVMPLATYQANDGPSVDRYGVSIGTFQDQDLRALHQV